MLSTETQIDLKTEIEELKLDHEVAFENEYGIIYLFKNEKVLLCQLTKGYVPIDHFKTVFNKIGEIVEELNIERFIFDKRKLEAFHQPSMEWYFTEWKSKMLESGLTKHRKIMPDEIWFEQAVEAGRNRIMQKYPEAKETLDKLDIEYRSSVREAFYE